MKSRHPAVPRTTEDVEIWRRLIERWPGYAMHFNFQVYCDGDRRDADAMLVMVELHASRIVQAVTGDWCYFGHSSQAVFSNETLQ